MDDVQGRIRSNEKKGELMKEFELKNGESAK